MKTRGRAMKQVRINKKVLATENNCFQSYAGYKVNFDDDRWRIKGDVSINLSTIKEQIRSDLFYSYKVVLKYFVENYSGDTVRNYNHSVSRYFRSQDDKSFSLTAITNYRSQEENNAYMANVRAFLIRWHKLKEPGVSDDLIARLQEWKVSMNETGTAVLSNDPNKGPLEDVERESFIIKGANALENGDINVSDFAISLIFISLGVRAGQISQLKIKDVRISEGRVYPYSINMPLSKKGKGFRKEFLESFLVEDIYRIIQLHIDSLTCKINGHFGFRVENSMLGEIPLFPCRKFWSIGTYGELCNDINSDKFHTASATIGKAPNRISKKTNLLNRCRDPLILNSRRLRYTFATNLVSEGHDIVAVAKLLGHSGTHNVRIYFKNTTDFVKHIRERTKGKMSDFAAAFSGEVVDSLAVAKNGNRGDMQVVEESGHMGVCGRDYRCESHPVVCYTCPNFQPLIEADHKSLLDNLVKERSRVECMTKDQSVIEAQDHVIKAVARVLQICQERIAEDSK